MNWFVLSLFLYFPKDKTEYIPAVIWMIVTFIAAIIVMRLFIKISKKEAQEAKKYEQIHQSKEANQENK
ncbi:hypothetical protein [Bacillus sp. B15-48]|uniref:hypothetical protein n=1 Tax=Bacillus sp. B15-48 TaxID=1548601 RepID=UPI00193FB43F|nr:hypothetical protein [Bacillus sp. B15-48]MBM4760706.1 hypothetical protein [Bacillus sp. B15-48]